MTPRHRARCVVLLAVAALAYAAVLDGYALAGGYPMSLTMGIVAPVLAVVAIIIARSELRAAARPRNCPAMIQVSPDNRAEREIGARQCQAP